MRTQREDRLPLDSTAMCGANAPSEKTLTRRSLLRAAGGVGGMLVVGGGITPLMSACGGSGSSETGSKQITAGVFQNPDSLDPGVTGLVTSGQILYTMFDPLMWLLPDPQTGEQKMYPGLAERVSVSPDARAYTFTLKKGVHFHDGTPFTADAVKATFDHVVDPATKSRSAIGALGPYKETVVVDDHTAKVVFSQPNAAFMNEMTTVVLAISSPAALKKYGTDYGRHPVGTGPFVFKDFVSSQHVTVTRNSDYKWGPPPLAGGAAKLQEITFRILPDPSAQFNALQTGEITIAQNLNPQDIARAGDKFKRLTAPARGMPYCIMVNAAKPPTDDLRVRQALEFAVNQQQIIEDLFKGIYEPADSIVTPVTPGYDKSQALYHHDPAKAGRLLDAAGWTKGPGGIRHKNGQQLGLSFINIADYGFDGISQLMQAQFKELGISTKIRDQSFPSVATTYNKGVQNLADWFYYDVDPFLFKTVFSCGQIKSGFNWEHYCDHKVDHMISQANATADEAKRTALYKEISQKLAESATIIPIYNLKSVLVAPTNLKDVVFTVGNAQPLYHATHLA